MRVLIRAATSLALAVLLTGTAQAADWIAPHQLAEEVGHPVLRSVNRIFRAGWDGPVVDGQIVAVASLNGLRALEGQLVPGTWVIYDLERWAATPDEEEAEPQRSMRRFVSIARSYGYLAILAPGGSFAARAIYRDADAFLAQVQSRLDPVVYREKVCEITRAFDGPVYAELAANGKPGHTATGLLRQWRAGRACTSYFAIWAGRDPDASSVATVQAFLSRALEG